MEKYKHSESTRCKIGDGNRGKTVAASSIAKRLETMKEMIDSGEFSRRISAGKTGKPNGRNGLKHTTKAKLKMSLAKGGAGSGNSYDTMFLRLYGITWNDYEQMLDEQNGVCAICGSENKSGKKLYVDHDHYTGKVRGLLCVKCNGGLGFFNDDINIIESARRYIINANTNIITK